MSLDYPNIANIICAAYGNTWAEYHEAMKERYYATGIAVGRITFIWQCKLTLFP